MTPHDSGALFDMTGRVVVITGGAGLLGRRHAAAVARLGATPILVDVRRDQADQSAAQVSHEFGCHCIAIHADITNEESVRGLLEDVLARYGRVDVLINNAANNPTVGNSSSDVEWTRLENLPRNVWDGDIAVGLTGAFLCSQTLGAEMARRGRGVIINIASDLAVIAPDQRLYARSDRPSLEQPVKPVTYSVVKTALIGLTRYLATYWADRGVRANALSPGGVYDGQSEDFVARLTTRIPLARMANVEEYEGAIMFLSSDASSYMTGANLIIDGGRSCW
jgi:NAD(P)-dependent dehydrogenase (short-subunit alcohol dehydrogenase family)